MSDSRIEKPMLGDYLAEYIKQEINEGRGVTGAAVNRGVRSFERGYASDALRRIVTVRLHPHDDVTSPQFKRRGQHVIRG